MWANDQNMGRTSLSRRNVDMKSYADTVVDIGQRLGVPVVNLWRAFMAMTPWREETWKSGEAMIGSLELPQDDALVELSHDGRFPIHQYVLQGFANLALFRSALQPCRLQDTPQGVHENHPRKGPGVSPGEDESNPSTLERHRRVGSVGDCKQRWALM